MILGTVEYVSMVFEHRRVRLKVEHLPLLFNTSLFIWLHRALVVACGI